MWLDYISNLIVDCNKKEALIFARRHLESRDWRRLSCPVPPEAQLAPAPQKNMFPDLSRGDLENFTIQSH